ncbi:MAG: class I SAM-dependent methyltransferase [Gallionellaceae bacterium]|nr:class I SAM-dependent methyltransferase [Gallionellaceae bacterium]
MTMVKLHEEHWSNFMENAHHRSLYDSWWTPGTVNFWRHTRLLAPVLEVLSGLKTHSWLTIGDGAGTDAWRLLQAGFKQVLATDLDDTVLSQTHQSGLISEYKIENAERLSFGDNSIDFVLCKEALHHMSRPYAAIYEFFRVARYGVVVIEPQDKWIDWPCLTTATSPHYEAVGNYVYQFSVRELEKIAYGMNITGIATNQLVDVYIEGCEFASCTDGDPIWEKTRAQVEEFTKAMKNGTVKASYIQGIFFKNTVTPEVFELLARQYPEWRFMRTDTNPHLNQKAA